MRPNHSAIPVFLCLLVLIASACNTPGVQADTFNKRVVVANATIEQATKTVETLFVAGKINRSDAQSYNAKLTTAAKGIDSAVLIHATDVSGGENNLAAIIAILNAITTELEKRQ